jgi:hypothetical protein
MVKFDLLDVLAPLVGAVVWLVLSWLYARSVNPGRPLNPVQKGMMIYGLVFVLGMGYLIMLGGALHWSNGLMFSSIAVWVTLVAATAWRRSKRSRR